MSLIKKEIEKAQEAIKFLSSITLPDSAQTGVSLARSSARLLTIGHPNVSTQADSLASETSRPTNSSNTDRCEYNCQICNLWRHSHYNVD